ncbi:hypothetical protein KC19_VG168600 [Ceratodon purpureus]|uniref:Uncharacterized protein n=1 Tax=Ceratodon purpureus TaxID=3225 RepID=A0A8T0HQS9_CERPU|nr:hypothetical protein KC19_VG168600 [Ceratodon purpureus]
MLCLCYVYVMFLKACSVMCQVVRRICTADTLCLVGKSALDKFSNYCVLSMVCFLP